MSLTLNMETGLDIALRIPPLFVWDSALRQTLLWPLDAADIHGIQFMLYCLLVFFSVIVSVVMFHIPTYQLIKSYKFVVTGTALCLSFYFNSKFIEIFISTEFSLSIWWCYLLLKNLLVQVSVGCIYNAFIYNLQQEEVSTDVPDWYYYTRSFRPYVYTVLLTPLLCSIVGLPQKHLEITPVVVFCIVALEYTIALLCRIKIIVVTLTRAYIGNRRYLRNFGLQNFIERHWTRIRIPTLLRTFWSLRFLYHVTYFTILALVADKENHTMKIDFNLYDRFSTMNYEHLMKNSSSHWEAQDVSVSLLEKEETGVIANGLDVLEKSLVMGCNNVIALLGMTSVLSRIAHYVGLALSWFVRSTNEEDRSIGTMTAMLFFILAIQTGLTGMIPEQRLVRLGRNMYLLTTAILHFVHGMVNPVLLNLSASQHHLPRKHIRPLIMCVLLMLLPTVLLYYLWGHHTASTWLLAVTAFSVEVVIKVFISLLTYALFMIDAYRTTVWDGLDDCIYYIKAVGNCIEFVFGIFLFCNGFWILVFESGGTIRAVMMCIHAYFNIWGQAKEGWLTFMRRRTAVSKINSLPQATPAQLETINDVCAICYQELNSACITRCGHFFHGVCLRKWLYVQDKCPLCHNTVYAAEKPSESRQEQDEQMPNLERPFLEVHNNIGDL